MKNTVYIVVIIACFVLVGCVQQITTKENAQPVKTEQPTNKSDEKVEEKKAKPVQLEGMPEVKGVEVEELARPTKIIATQPKTVKKIEPVDDKTATWFVYDNQEYDFTIKHPVEWVPNETTHSGSLVKLHQVLIRSTLGARQEDGMIRKPFVRIDIWDPGVPDMQILESFIELDYVTENKRTVDGWPTIEYVYNGPNQIWGGIHDYRMYIIRTAKYTYSIYSESCWDNKEAECDLLLANFDVK